MGLMALGNQAGPVSSREHELKAVRNLFQTVFNSNTSHGSIGSKVTVISGFRRFSDGYAQRHKLIAVTHGLVPVGQTRRSHNGFKLT